MKKKYLIAIIIFCMILNITLLTTIIIPSYSNYRENKELEEKLQNATIKVTLKDNLNVSLLSKVKVSDFIESINGEITDDYIINTSKLGDKEVSFNYINDEQLEIPYTFKINVIDDIPPVIWVDSTYTVNTNYNGNLLEDITCADNYDDNPTCEILGEYKKRRAISIDF